MKINVLTLFPDMFGAIQESILGRAIENEHLELNIINIRDYTKDKHNRVDDTPFGGGAGMVMQVEPIKLAIDNSNLKGRCIYMSPRGKQLDKEIAMELSEEKEFTILCGHYEGIDQRVIDMYEMEEITIGDYVLTGGELPAMVLIDTVARFIEGVLSSEESALEESIYSGLLEYPQYTKPREIYGKAVPEVLCNGNHKLIKLWKLEKSLELTKENRPDLFESYMKNHGELGKEELKILNKFK
ncbi:MAG: tRNA (guanosine(37)-N1)-methyltransferase TrmD [Peptostreptococcaceae bacterium]|nr:tRNA (guanosine(37)-N1)-methyltransferase TrmD [Peptostreptococcaceae bacterium]